MIEICDSAISPDAVIAKVKSDGSGCVITYVGLIRDHYDGKLVYSVEYQDSTGNAKKMLQQIAGEAKRRWPLENVAISHRTGKLKVGEINLVIAVASAHRAEGFAACEHIIDQLKQGLPTRKIETYRDGSTKLEEVAQKT